MKLLTALAAFVALFTAPALAQERILPQSPAQMQFSFAPLVKKVAPAVVNIYTKRTVTARQFNPFMDDPFFQQFFGGAFGGMGAPGGLSRKLVQNALGSGVIVDQDGLVVTNAHVVDEADEINAVLPDGREFDAKKILVDKSSDLAVLKIENKGAALPFVSLQASGNLEVGDLVLAIGNPFGVGQTVTSGIVSALARSSLDISDFNFFIQTDAAINPGNSGGPLVAMDGSVVGINSAIYSKDGGSLGIGFAVPSDMVVAVLAAVKSGQKGDRIIRPWLGVTAQKVTADIAESLGFAAPSGLLIAALHEASPLRAAGAEVGDVITAMNGHSVTDPGEVKFRMATVPLGGEATFQILRKGEARTLKVEAIAPPDVPPRAETELTGYSPLAGATVANINPAVSVELGIAEDQGIVVTAVDPRTPATRVVEPGDIILAVNNIKIDKVGTLQKALKAARQWQLLIDSQGRKRQVIVRG